MRSRGLHEQEKAKYAGRTRSTGHGQRRSVFQGRGRPRTSEEGNLIGNFRVTFLSCESPTKREYRLVSRSLQGTSGDTVWVAQSAEYEIRFVVRPPSTRRSLTPKRMAVTPFTPVPSERNHPSGTSLWEQASAGRCRIVSRIAIRSNRNTARSPDQIVKNLQISENCRRFDFCGAASVNQLPSGISCLQPPCRATVPRGAMSRSSARKALLERCYDHRLLAASAGLQWLSLPTQSCTAHRTGPIPVLQPVPGFADLVKRAGPKGRHFSPP